ncbi:hypothetical protein G3488_10570 [Shewanella baltica]|uniref:hypothetical protein n=1 Tax=Shewanella baltica TaxID=62322 RepID=UPI00217D602C|nr:hypothetical protein [Shewanella baltica]MCS6231296.1 hypothetical protein [Shewanella baltica]
MKTIEVKNLVREVLETLPTPYSHHVIDEVFYSIENEPLWRERYEALCSTLTKDVVNNWGGRWVAITLGKSGEQQVSSKKSNLINSYSLLDTDAKTIAKKPSESEARLAMSQYYQAHKNELPPSVRNSRELIVALITEGMATEEAFLAAISR